MSQHKPLLQLFQDLGCRLPVEVHLVNFRVVVLNLGVNMADKDCKVGQATLHGEYFGKAADVFADVIHQTLHI